MSKRRESLERIAAVQRRLVTLADMRLGQAEHRCRDLRDDQGRLRAFIAQTDALGSTLAKAAARATHSLDKRLALAEQDREHHRAQRDLLKRREHTVANMAEGEALAARRAAADRDLADTMDAWHARLDASLP